MQLKLKGRTGAGIDKDSEFLMLLPCGNWLLRARQCVLIKGVALPLSAPQDGSCRMTEHRLSSYVQWPRRFPNVGCWCAVFNSFTQQECRRFLASARTSVSCAFPKRLRREAPRTCIAGLVSRQQRALACDASHSVTQLAECFSIDKHSVCIQLMTTTVTAATEEATTAARCLFTRSLFEPSH